MWTKKLRTDEFNDLRIKYERETAILQKVVEDLEKDNKSLKAQLSYYESPQTGQTSFNIEAISPIGIERRYNYSYDSYNGTRYLVTTATVFMMPDHSEFVLTTTQQDHDEYVKKFNNFLREEK